jgi:hypothetical protein
MTDFADIDTLSTTIDTEAGPAAGGGGVVEAQPEPTTVRADLEAAFREDDGKADAKAEQPADKPGDEPKPAKEEAPAKDGEKPEEKVEEAKPERTRADDGKFARPEAKDEQQKEERTRVDAPQSFLPKAREVWRNTPHAVQQEVARMAQEHAAATEQTRETVERYESFRQYDDLARSNGRDLRQSLERMTQVEDMLQSNPVAGLNAILMEVGPRKADGQPFSLYEIAQFIASQQPDQYQQMVAQPRQQPQEDPRIAQYQQRIAQSEERYAQDTIVKPFAAANPRYTELEQPIALILQSGMVPSSLSPAERLATAYDMAERMYPPSHDDRSEKSGGLAEQRRADDDFSGSKSIKSSPGSVTETYEPEAKRGESIRDSLRAEARRMTR